MIQPCIALVPRQADAVSKLVKHCRALDGTELKVIPVDDSKYTPKYPHNELSSRCSWSLRTVALEMKGRPFLWLEPDAIPLSAGWLSKITEEYERAKKPFMMPLIENGEHDVASGIGVYPGDTHFLVPLDYSELAWDYFIYRQLRPLVHFTKLIQHNYGRYHPKGHVKEKHVSFYHRFPRDKSILRKEAVIFHSDKRQTLIPSYENQIFHTGDLGDVIAAMPVIRQLGGGHLTIGEMPAGVKMPGRESLKGKRFEFIKPLLESQPYIKSVRWGERHPETDFDFSDFRDGYVHRENLAQWQARYAGIENFDQSKWIDVAPSPESRGRVVIARSPRYHGVSFPWRRVISEHRNKLIFVGLPDEHAAFEREFNSKVEFKPTENALYLAKIIAGSDLFIGNQSSPSWIAMGLAQNLIQEVWPTHPNSMVHRSNAKFVFLEQDY